jgi:hypothetical protein
VFWLAVTLIAFILIRQLAEELKKHCQARCLSLTRKLKEEMPDKALMLENYALNMERRLETIAAIKIGDDAAVVRLMKRAAGLKASSS